MTGHEGHDHSAHEGHNHSSHNHDHSGHSHDTHEGHSHDAHVHSESEGAHNHGDGTIQFTEQQAQEAGLVTETVALGKFSNVIRTGGEILPAQGDEKTVVAVSSGVLSYAGKVLPGVKVAQGAVLAVVSASSMAEGDPAVKAKAEFDAAEKDYLRQKELLKTESVSRKAFEEAEARYLKAKAEYAAFEGRVREGGVEIQSPIAGYIKSVLVSEGEYVAAGQPIAVVARNRRLQLQADVPEKYFTKVSSVKTANFKPSYSETVYSLDDLDGRLVSVGATSASRSYYIPAIFEFNNVGDFVPGSFAEIYLVCSERDNVISVPESALTEEQGLYFVYLKLCKEDYKKQEVKVGGSDGIRREITAGLKVGDEVVTKGVFQVKLASVSGVVPEGHSHNH